MAYDAKLRRVSVSQELEMKSGSKLLNRGGQDILPAIEAIGSKGTMRYVDGTDGSDAKDGLSWATAYKTLTVAVAAAAAGDTILVRGSITESVTVALAGLSIVGVGTTPRDACYWNPVAGNDKVNLTINAQHVRVENLYFRPGPKSATYSACIVLGTGASHARIVNNRFQGSTGAYYAIYSPAVGADNVHVIGNEFMYFNTATHGSAIRGVNAGGVNYSGWRICDNAFLHCVTAIFLSCRGALITGNTIAEYGVNPAGSVAQLLALGIDLSGTDTTSSGANCVWGNQLGGTYNATLYKVGASGDQWGGNWNVLTGGVTAANPT